MPRKPKIAEVYPTVVCPFTVAIDTREQHPYAFAGFLANSDQKNAEILVKTERVTLKTGQGDYSIVELPTIGVERKSKADLWGSISQGRDNFEHRLSLMSSLDYAIVVVEAEISEILSDPPRHTKYPAKSLIRTIQAWMIRHRLVHWAFLPDRRHAEAVTFRMLSRFWDESRKTSQ